jgi:hypothetical protein
MGSDPIDLYHREAMNTSRESSFVHTSYKTVPTDGLCSMLVGIDVEIKMRLWKYIRMIGYKPYKEHRMEFTHCYRGDTRTVKFKAIFEQNFVTEEISFEIPALALDTLVLEEK